MKVKKGTVFLAFVAVFLLMWGANGISAREKAQELFLDGRDSLRTAACQVLAQGDTENVLLPEGCRSVSLWTQGRTTVDFSLGGAGLGSNTVYYGITYVPDDMPIGFQGARWEYWRSKGDGRLYYEPESDNTCYVERLAPMWYYYEARF